MDNILPPNFYFSGNEEIARSLIPRARACLQHTLLQVYAANQNEMVRQYPLIDGSVIEIRTRMLPCYNNRENIITIYGQPIENPEGGERNVYVTYADRISDIILAAYVIPYQRWEYRFIHFDGFNPARKDHFYAGDRYWVDKYNVKCVSWVVDDAMPVFPVGNSFQSPRSVIYIAGRFCRLPNTEYLVPFSTTIGIDYYPVRDVINCVCLSGSQVLQDLYGYKKFAIVYFEDRGVADYSDYGDFRIYGLPDEVPKGSQFTAVELASRRLYVDNFTTSIPVKEYSKCYGFLSDGKTLIMSRHNKVTQRQILYRYVFSDDYSTQDEEIIWQGAAHRIQAEIQEVFVGDANPNYQLFDVFTGAKQSNNVTTITDIFIHKDNITVVCASNFEFNLIQGETNVGRFNPYVTFDSEHGIFVLVTWDGSTAGVLAENWSTNQTCYISYNLQAHKLEDNGGLTPFGESLTNSFSTSRYSNSVATVINFNSVGVPIYGTPIDNTFATSWTASSKKIVFADWRKNLVVSVNNEISGGNTQEKDTYSWDGGEFDSIPNGADNLIDTYHLVGTGSYGEGDTAIFYREINWEVNGNIDTSVSVYYKGETHSVAITHEQVDFSTYYKEIFGQLGDPGSDAYIQAQLDSGAWAYMPGSSGDSTTSSLSNGMPVGSPDTTPNGGDGVLHDYSGGAFDSTGFESAYNSMQQYVTAENFFNFEGTASFILEYNQDGQWFSPFVGFGFNIYDHTTASYGYDDNLVVVAFTALDKTVGYFDVENAEKTRGPTDRTILIDVRSGTLRYQLYDYRVDKSNIPYDPAGGNSDRNQNWVSVTSLNY